MMVRFRASKVPADFDLNGYIIKVIPTRKEGFVLKKDEGARIDFPSVHIEYTEILNDSKIPKRAFFIEFRGQRREYCASFLAKHLEGMGIIIDKWE